MSETIVVGNVFDVLPTLSAQSVQCVVTSPPYWGLRDYGVEGQLGLERTPEEYTEKMVRVFQEVRRVLRDDGTMWLVLGDCFCSSPRGNKAGDFSTSSLTNPGRQDSVSRTSIDKTKLPGLKSKDLVGIPWMVAFALRADGWYLRSDIVWAKPNPMPESVRDRPTKAHEYVFLLTKNARYFYDAEAVKEPTSPASTFGTPRPGKPMPSSFGAHRSRLGNGSVGNASGRNRRTVWTVATQPFPEAHFACVDDQTEALTATGWKLHNQIEDGEYIVGYNAVSGRLGWQRATIHRYDYDGELVAIEKRDASQRLTPNHRCLVRRRSGLTAIVRADELRAGMEVPTAAEWEWNDAGPGCRSVGGTTWAALIGWYISEGSNYATSQVRIYQSESANPSKVAAIRAALAEVKATVVEYKRTREWRGRPSVEIEFVITGTVAFELQKWAPTKTMTGDLVSLPREEAEALLDALIEGDGCRRTDGRSCIVQKDRRSIDLMQALAVRLGYRAHLSTREDGIHCLYLTRGEWLTLRGTNGSHGPIPREQYTGVVWCPSVGSGFWLARRNGKPFITGNTFPEKLVEPCVLAGSRAGDTVLDPFAGSGTVGVVCKRHGRDFVGIDLNPDYEAMMRRRIEGTKA